MLSPTPFSLCCTLLLCLPLAFFFSTTTTPILDAASKSTHNENPNATISSGAENPPQNLSFAQSALPNDDDDDDDKALFRLAGHTNPNPKDPKKIAFMFLTTTPLPFAPLWHLFFNPNQTHPNPQNNRGKNLFNIYVHADPNRPYDQPFTGLFAGRTIPSKSTRRSDPSLITAARRLLAQALLHDPSNAMFALLSPSCIPLHSFPFVYRTLTNWSTKSFIEILKNEPNIRNRYDARGKGAMLPEVPFESFRVGSQFFVLTRRHARLVVKDVRLWAKFRLKCAWEESCYPEEHYFPTLLRMADPSACVPATLTHVDWTGSVGGHPHTYGADEVRPELVRGLRTKSPRYGNGLDGAWNGSAEYPFLFARKFVPDCLEPLMGMAEDVIFRD